MITIKVGNILNCEEDIICHQVNVGGFMGGGLARQLADQYPGLEETYAKYCKEHNNRFIDLCGDVFYYKDDKIIGNIFSQKENFDTSYLNMEIALRQIKNYAKTYNLSVCIPYGIGCGIANGEWDKVYKIIFDYDIALYKLD